MYRSILTNLFPFIRWFPMSGATLRADLIAGITVALVLIPQSMAYAQLAGLPVVYGLYASFLPVIVASLWGSLPQLHTGPVAMLSLMSAAAVLPLAPLGSEAFITLSVMLALMVGVLRLALGLLRMGILVNFLSSPVIIGFTNAAALIIGLSQLSKILNVPFPRTDNFVADLWTVFEQLQHAHVPTLLFAIATYAVIVGVKRYSPKLPGVLLAVVLTTWSAGPSALNATRPSASRPFKTPRREHWSRIMPRPNVPSALWPIPRRASIKRSAPWRRPRTRRALSNRPCWRQTCGC
jgi:SulP family sulfate permease